MVSGLGTLFRPADILGCQLFLPRMLSRVSWLNLRSLACVVLRAMLLVCYVAAPHKAGKAIVLIRDAKCLHGFARWKSLGVIVTTFHYLPLAFCWLFYHVVKSYFISAPLWCTVSIALWHWWCTPCLGITKPSVAARVLLAVPQCVSTTLCRRNRARFRLKCGEDGMAPPLLLYTNSLRLAVYPLAHLVEYQAHNNGGVDRLAVEVDGW